MATSDLCKPDKQSHMKRLNQMDTPSQLPIEISTPKHIYSHGIKLFCKNTSDLFYLKQCHENVLTFTIPHRFVFILVAIFHRSGKFTSFWKP